MAESKTYSTGPNDAIMWKHKIDNGGIMTDPNNPSRTVIVINNKATDTIQCMIYFRDMLTAANATHHKPDAQIESPVGFWKRFNPNWRKFHKLKKLIQQNNVARENHSFLGKLHNVFPGTFDDFIFGKK